MKGLDCMLYTSEILNKSFKSEEECLKAEQEHNEKLALEEKKQNLLKLKRQELKSLRIISEKSRPAGSFLFIYLFIFSFLI